MDHLKFFLKITSWIAWINFKDNIFSNIISIIFFPHNFVTIYISMNWLWHLNCKNENTKREKPWCDWLINYIREVIKKRWLVIRAKSSVFLKQNNQQLCVWRQAEIEETKKKTIRRKNNENNRGHNNYILTTFL